ncbi:MAG TPA: ferredoxin--NADP reductase [Gammaproteobacteria bacterium]|nr:ferredoxin--NADP reductase [Gammaproteobacteria bacterium]
MPNLQTERVLDVRHWNNGLFSFKTTRNQSLRFENGQFLMLGLAVNDKPLLRAYSVASANWEETLEFFSINVPGGALTSRLQHLKQGDEIILSKKPTGTLLIHDLKPGKNLYLFATGTGLAPFLSIIKDLETYERFDTIILAHGVRHIEDLAYYDYLTQELPQHEVLGELVSSQFRYYPAVTREPFRNSGRLTHLIESGKMQKDLGLPPLNPETDRAMLCGGQGMLKDFRELLDGKGFQVAKHIGDVNDYVYERAFVDK